MLISKIMTKSPIYVHPEFSMTETHAIMEREKIGHLPVLNKNSELVGIITKQELHKAAPSAATSLDIYEINYLLAKLTVEKVMVKKVITVQEDETVEKAAKIMADSYIGCLPVMKGSMLVGIVTDTDIFQFFVNAFGARHKGVRITVNAKEQPGQIAALAGAVAKEGGNIVALVTSEGDDVAHRRATFKITGVSLAAVEAAAKGLDGVEIEDMREG